MTVTRISFSLPLVARNPRLASIYACRSSPEPSALDSENIYQKNSNCSPSLNITYKEIHIVWSVAFFRHLF